ncbi:MAG: aminoglycoside phosphotransferase family protein [Gammaproteobacteria bacterium]|nr:aminoglycoside phosphotransferase family protein [Gammaproteobacteria bacterium]
MHASIDEMVEWAQAYFARQSELLQGFEEVRIMPWSQVYRITISKHKVIYLKHMSPPFAIEARLLQYWARQQNNQVPKILAANADLNCFLMEDSGECLRPLLKENYRMEWVCKALQSYAKLQQHEVQNLNKLLALGVPDWRLAKLPGLYAELIGRTAFLKAEGLSDQEIQSLHDLKPKVAEMCQRLSAFPVPETLEHGDFQDNNILLQGDRLIVNDWGDAVISHPFFSLVSFLDSARRNHGILEGSAEVHSKLRDTYLDAWLEYASKDKIMECFELAQHLGAIKFAISFYRVALCPGMENLAQYQGTIAAALRRMSREGFCYAKINS